MSSFSSTSSSSSGRSLMCQAMSEHFGRKLSRRFSVNDELLCPSEDDSEAEQESILLNLPQEVQMLIFESVAHAPSQVALALSCKGMARIANSINLNRAYTSAKYAGLLPKEVFDVPDLMRQLSPWMPSHLRLCDHCLTNRPADPSYWSNVTGCEVGNFWITKTGWSFADASWHKQLHNICPSCHLTCSLGDFSDCDGCKSLGRLGDVDWARVSDTIRRRSIEEELRAGRFAT